MSKPVNKKSTGSKILIIIGIIALSVAGIGASAYYINKIFFEKSKNIELDTSQQAIYPDKQNNNSRAGAEYIKVAGYSNIKATKDASTVQLKNPEGNTVNFIYTITRPIKTETVKAIKYADEKGKQSAITEAAKYISDNTVKFTNSTEGNGYTYINEKTKEETKYAYSYEMKDTGTEIVIEKKEKELIYFTKGISPGKSVDWDVRKSLSYSCDVTFEISTYDITDNHPTTGSNISVHIEILD